MTDSICSKSHKEWRKVAKKFRRKRVRQKLAECRKEEQKLKESSPSYLTELTKQRLLEEYELEVYERERKERHDKWLKDEEEAQKVFKEQQRLKDLAKEEKIRELQRIKTEWEAEQKKIRERNLELERIKQEEEKRKQETLQRINDFIEHGGEVPLELLTVKETNPRKELCSFFTKVGACRFGSQCSRNHQHPGISKVLLFSNFYTHFTLDQNHSSEYDTDIGLEFEESDTYMHFTEFYNDVVPELKCHGKVKMVKVCCNTEFHLRGNVYVEYSSLREALVAYKKFQGRWYGGKQLNLEFINISDWGSAVCGDFARNRCPKGKSCNFLHVFQNPKNEFPIEWNRLKSGNSHSVSDSCHNGFDSPPGRHTRMRWSETPVRIVEKSVKDVDRKRRRRRSRSSSSERRHKSVRHKRHMESRRKRSPRSNSSKKEKHEKIK